MFDFIILTTLRWKHLLQYGPDRSDNIANALTRRAKGESKRASSECQLCLAMQDFHYSTSRTHGRRGECVGLSIQHCAAIVRLSRVDRVPKKSLSASTLANFTLSLAFTRVSFSS